MKVSVLIVTYNQERYIEQAVRSALMQRTSFDYEIVVGEDCSTDTTAEILRRLEQEHPVRLRVLCTETNLGMMANYKRTYLACRGQYTALLEGDDYWTNPDKLQKQTVYLDSHPECILCFHDVLAFIEGVPQDLRPYVRPEKEITGLEEILEDIYINTSSVLLRAGAAPAPPSWTTDLVMGDWPFFIHLARYGKFGYIAETMGAYRKHDNGVWQRAKLGDQVQSLRTMYDRVNEDLGYKYDLQIQIFKRRAVAQAELVASVIDWMHKAQAARGEVERLEKVRRKLKKECQAMANELAAFRAQQNSTNPKA